MNNNDLYLKKHYRNWIEDNYPTSDSAKRKCAEATQLMVEMFPELIRVRGLVHVEEPFDLPPTKTTHWWCVDPEGFIVDPTAHQYPTWISKYDPVDEDKGEPTGKCPNCGDLCYDHAYLCSDSCEKQYMAYLNRSI